MISEHERVNAATAAAQRAWLALAALETARTSDDVDRARHGAQHELETLLRVLGGEVPELPRGATTRGRRADVTIMDDELPFAEPCSGFCGTSTDPEKLCASCYAEVAQSCRQAAD